MADHRAFMKMYWGDFLADTMHLNAAETGAYLMLIATYWQRGGLPSDEQALAQIARLTPYQWKKFAPVLAKFFQPGWRHKRIDHELQLADAAHEKRSVAGVIGNSKRWAMRSQSDRNATHIQNRYITSTEYVLKRKEDANRGSEGSEKDQVSPALRAIVERKGWKPP